MTASRGLYASMALIAAAALAYQLLLLRLLAIVQWSALAGTVVSLALLGHGASGTLLAVMRRRALAHASSLYLTSAAAFAVATAGCFALAQRVPFNALELIWDWTQWPRLAAVYGLLALPFLFAATCFGLAFMRHGNAIARLYAADLAGAAIGAAALMLALWWLAPEDALRAVSGLALAGAAAALPACDPSARRRMLPILACAAALVVALPRAWIEPRPSQYKGEQRALATIGAAPAGRASSPYGSLGVVTSPRVPPRHAPGLSLLAQTGPSAQLAIFTDGDAPTYVTDCNGSLDYLGQMTSALPYSQLHRPRVLALNSGGGEPVLQALTLGAAWVVSVEPNPQLLALVRDRYASAGGSVYRDARVQAVAADPRAYLRSGSEVFDLIQIPARESPAGVAAGAAAAEAYLYTVQAVGDALRRLDAGGLLSYTVWERLPPRDSVRLLATAIATLRAQGVDDPARRIAMIRNWQTSTLLLKNGRFDANDVAALHAFCARFAFEAIHVPGNEAARVNRDHQTPGMRLHDAARALLSPQASPFLHAYKFDVAPVDDDRPFFFQFVKLRSLPELLRLRAQGGIALLDAGYLLVAATALQAIVYSLLLIGMPLLWLRSGHAGLRRRVGVYFAALGLAFLFIEIVWLHRLVLLLGHPLLAAGAGLSTFLLFAGLGSAAADRLGARSGRASIPLAVGLLVAWLLALEIAWQPLLDVSAGWPLAVRASAALLALAPLAWCMGLPFPLGLERVTAQAPALVPWAWAINGCLSVCAAALASLLAMHLGFQAVLLGAAALYVLAATLLR